MLERNHIERLCIYAFFLCIFSCQNKNEVTSNAPQEKIKKTGVELIVLGNVQDAGSPHIACIKDCCKHLFKNPDKTRKVVSLGILDHTEGKSYLFEASPNIASQLKILQEASQLKEKSIPDGIFLTHAHIGHYTGLMYLGKEATNANLVPVYAMSKMKSFLENNGPWSQLVQNQNIQISSLKEDSAIVLSNDLQVIPFIVPHRDEFSETVGFKIIGPNKSILFIPDIDKWSKWSKSIVDEVAKVDYAFLDGTFYNAEEINTRDISEIPHPFVIESMELFASLSKKEKQKIHFIHFNHTNPLLNEKSDFSKKVIEGGFGIARFLTNFNL